MTTNELRRGKCGEVVGWYAGLVCIVPIPNEIFITVSMFSFVCNYFKINSRNTSVLCSPLRILNDVIDFEIFSNLQHSYPHICVHSPLTSVGYKLWKGGKANSILVLSVFHFLLAKKTIIYYFAALLINFPNDIIHTEKTKIEN